MFVSIIIAPFTFVAGIPQYASNPGSINYYALLYLVSPLVFISYDFAYCLVLPKSHNNITISKMEEVRSSAFAIIITTFLIVIPLYLYTTRKYGLTSTGFNIEMVTMDNEWLKSFCYLFNGLLGIIIAAIIIDSRNKIFIFKLIYLFILAFIFIIIALPGSRSNSIKIACCAIVIYQIIYNPKQFKIFITILLILLTSYLITTFLRTSPLYDEIHQKGIGIDKRIRAARESFTYSSDATEKMGERIFIDIGYRLNFIEFPAAILMQNIEYNIPFMWGEDNLWGVYQAIPSILIPFPKQEPEEVAVEHFSLEGFDQNSSILSSAIADAGIIGIPIVFAIVGIFHAMLFRLLASPSKNPASKYLLFAILPNLLNCQVTLGDYIFVTMRYAIIYYVYILIIIELLNMFKKPYAALAMKERITP
jgi:hypothetical protein